MKLNTKILMLSAWAALAAPAAGLASGVVLPPFLRSEVTARVSAMGGVSAALPDDAGAMYYNPAGLAYVSEDRGVFSAWNGVDSRSRFVYFSGIFKAGKLGAFDLSYLRFNSTGEDIFDLDRRRNSPALTEKHALGLGWGRELVKNLALGGQWKILSSELGRARPDKMSAFDAGVAGRSSDGRFAAGAGIHNTDGERKAALAPDTTPMTVYLGGAGRFKLPDGSLLAALDFEKPHAQSHADARLGLEYSLARLALRGGMKTLNGTFFYTAGAGARIRRLALDYAYEPATRPDKPVHSLTITVFFGGERPGTAVRKDQ